MVAVDDADDAKDVCEWVPRSCVCARSHKEEINERINKHARESANNNSDNNDDDDDDDDGDDGNGNGATMS